MRHVRSVHTKYQSNSISITYTTNETQQSLKYINNVNCQEPLESCDSWNKGLQYLWGTALGVKNFALYITTYRAVLLVVSYLNELKARVKKALIKVGLLVK